MEANTSQTSGTNPEAATPPPASAPVKRENFADRVAREARDSGAFPGEVPLKRPDTAPTPPPEDKAKAQAPDDADLPDEIRKSPKASENFKKLRGERDEFRKKWETTDAELKKRSEPVKWEELPEVQALKKERDEYSEKLKVLDIERHDGFKREFDVPIEAEMKRANNLSAEYRAKFIATLNLPDGEEKINALNEIYEGMSTRERNIAANIEGRVAELREKRAAELSRYKELHPKMIQVEQERRESEHNRMKQEMEDAFSGVVAESQDKEKGLFVFQKRDGDEKWNSQVDQMTKAAKEVFAANLPAKERARAALWSVAAPAFLQEAVQRSKEIDVLKKELAELKSARPSVGGGHESKTVPSSGNESFAERVAREAKQAGLVR